jgi:hypothetical protein
MASLVIPKTKTTEIIPMGSVFDEFTPQTGTTIFENGKIKKGVCPVNNLI